MVRYLEWKHIIEEALLAFKDTTSEVYMTTIELELRRPSLRSTRDQLFNERCFLKDVRPILDVSFTIVSIQLFSLSPDLWISLFH